MEAARARLPEASSVRAKQPEPPPPWRPPVRTGSVPFGKLTSTHPQEAPCHPLSEASGHTFLRSPRTQTQNSQSSGFDVKETLKVAVKLRIPNCKPDSPAFCSSWLLRPACTGRSETPKTLILSGSSGRVRERNRGRCKRMILASEGIRGLPRAPPRQQAAFVVISDVSRILVRWSAPGPFGKPTSRRSCRKSP